MSVFIILHGTENSNSSRRLCALCTMTSASFFFGRIHSSPDIRSSSKRSMWGAPGRGGGAINEPKKPDNSLGDQRISVTQKRRATYRRREQVERKEDIQTPANCRAESAGSG